VIIEFKTGFGLPGQARRDSYLFPLGAFDAVQDPGFASVAGAGLPRDALDIHTVVILPEPLYLHLVQAGGLTERVNHLFSDEGLLRLAPVLLQVFVLLEFPRHGHTISSRQS